MNNTLVSVGEARMSFGETLAHLREAAGLTQVQLAERAGVAIDTLRRWEQGRNLPRIDDAYRLAKALGVPINKVVVGSDMDPPGDEGEPPAKPTRKPKGK
jgi:transcriptional regulator with XRE-family HTH domain